jgi:2-polyprenyl-6-methoxyphenol hydroxylase-like FAD-dependent oxidoreductase
LRKRPSQQLIVVGGGIGGLAAALAAATAGMAVLLLERAPEFAEIGAGIQLAPNATRVLAQWGLLPRLIDVGVLPARLVLRNATTAEELTSLDLGPRFRQAFGAPYIVLHRSDLLATLVDACLAHPAISLEVGREVTAVSSAAGGVEATCSDGSVHAGSGLVGADGLWSRVRRLVSDDEPVAWEYVSYRGAVPLEAVAEHPSLDDVVAWIGPGLHFVQYPLRRRQLYNQVAVFRSDEYRQGVPTWGGPEEMHRRFSNTCSQVQAALPALRQDNRWVMYDREPLECWSRGPVTLAGDAAHPMLQYLAQGACQAIADAECLGWVLRHHGGQDMTTCLAEYSARRAPLAATVQRRARIWGDIWHIDGVGVLLRDELLKKLNPPDYRYVDWLYRAPAPY